MPKDPKTITLEDFETELSNDVYKAALWFERAEGAGLIHGNGHHMAQQLARDAVEMMRKRAIQKQTALAMPSSAYHPGKRLRLFHPVCGSWPIGHLNLAEDRVYEIDEICLNPHGAVSVIGSEGWLGIKPDEMEWCE